MSELLVLACVDDTASGLGKLWAVMVTTLLFQTRRGTTALKGKTESVGLDLDEMKGS